MKNILFVCTGNHRRSPIAEHILKKLAKDCNNNDLNIGSAGVNHWYLGIMTDVRSCIAAQKIGYIIPEKTALLITEEDFIKSDVIYAMCHACMNSITLLCPEEHKHKIKLFLLETTGVDEEVLDTNYSSMEDFIDMAKTIEKGCLEIIRKID